MFFFGGRELTEEEKQQEEKERLERQEKRDLVQVLNKMLQATKEKLAEEEHTSSILKNQNDHLKYALKEKDEQIENMANQILDLDKKNQELIWSNQQLTQVKSRNEYEIEIEDTKAMMKALEQLNIDLHRRAFLIQFLYNRQKKRNSVANRFFTWKFNTKYLGLIAKKKEEYLILEEKLNDMNHEKENVDNIKDEPEIPSEKKSGIRTIDLNISSYSYLFKEFDVELDRLQRQILTTNDNFQNKEMTSLSIKIKNARILQDDSESIYQHLPSVVQTLNNEGRTDTESKEDHGPHLLISDIPQPSSTVTAKPFTEVETFFTHKNDEGEIQKQNESSKREDDMKIIVNQTIEQEDNSVEIPDLFVDKGVNGDNEDAVFANGFQQTFDLNNNEVEILSQENKPEVIDTKGIIDPTVPLSFTEKISPRPLVTSFSTLKSSPESPRSPRRQASSMNSMERQRLQATNNDNFSFERNTDQSIDRDIGIINNDGKGPGLEEEDDDMLETIHFSDDESSGIVDPDSDKNNSVGATIEEKAIDSKTYLQEDNDSNRKADIFSSVLNTTTSILFPLSHNAMVNQEKNYYAVRNDEDDVSKQGDDGVDTLFPDEGTESFAFNSKTPKSIDSFDALKSKTSNIQETSKVSNDAALRNPVSNWKSIPLHSGKEMSLSSENSFEEVSLSPSVSSSKAVDMDEVDFNQSVKYPSTYNKGKALPSTTLRSPINDIDEDENLYDDINNMKSGGISNVNTISHGNTESNYSTIFQSKEMVKTNQNKNHFFEEEEDDIDDLFPESGTSDFPSAFDGNQNQISYTGKTNSVFFDA